MANLDPVVQRFVADMSGYGRNIEEASRQADHFGNRQDAAALAARKMGLAASEAADKAARAQKGAADAAEKLARGELSQEEAAQKAAAATRELERADIKQAEASLAAARAAGVQADQYRHVANEAENRAQKERRDTQQMQGGLVSLIAAGVAAGAAVTGGAVAFTVFAAVAVPSIKRVLDAQMNLNKSWTTLDARQKTTSMLIQNVAGSYQKLAHSYEPQALATFNGLLGTAKGLLPQLNSVLGSSAAGVQDFVGQIEGFVSGPAMTHFLTWSGNTAPAALHTLGATATTTGTLATTLIEQIAPLGLSMLSAANGGLGLANALAKSNPALAQLAVTGLMVRAPMTALSSGVSNLATKMEGAAQGSGMLAKAGRALGSVAGLSPGLYVAAGTALAFFALKAFSAQSSTEKLIASLKMSTAATGNNIAGYREYASILSGNVVKATQQLNQVQIQVGGSTGKGTVANAAAGIQVMKLSSQQQQLRNSIEAANTSIHNITAGAGQLSGQMHITSSQAIQLANAAGVDLSRSIDKSGKLTQDATTKISDYAAAAAQARNPTLSLKMDFDLASNSTLMLKDRIVGLKDALDAYYNPSIAAYKATIALKDGYAGLLPALAKAKSDLSGNSAASRQLQTAFASQTDSVSQLYTATFEQTKSLSAASAAVKNQLPLLYALAGNNKTARDQVDALARSTHNMVGATDISRAAFLAEARSMGISKGRADDLWAALQKIKSKTVTMTVNTSAAEAAIQHMRDLAGQPLPAAHFNARGGPIYPYAAGGAIGLAGGGQPRRMPNGGNVWGAGTSTSDEIPVWASNGEYMVNAASYAANRQLVEAINSSRGKPVLGGQKSGSTLGSGVHSAVLHAMPLARRHYAETLTGGTGGSTRPVVQNHNYYIAGSVWSEQELLNTLQRVAFERGIDFNRPAGR